MLIILSPLSVNAFKGESSSYTLTHANINFVTSHDSSENYTNDLSIVQQPTLNSDSTNYTAFLGFYFGGILDFLREFNDWWFLAIVISLVTVIYILYHSLKLNEFMKIPISIGIILLILILLDVLMLGLDAFAGSSILSSIHGIVEIFFSIMTRLLPFIFIIWIIFFISYLIKSMAKK